jgi:predicted porin
MIGDLLKSASRVALVAVASITVSGVAAQAADLGGNCCADLEERVAELEATTARKGNRKVSLTVYGQVNEAVIFWQDGGTERNAYVVSNNNSRTRFGFRGDAKITSDISAGYLLEIGVRYANSTNRNQNADGAGGQGNQLDIRHSAWYLDSKSLGRVWVGKTSTATDGITEINLANINSGNADISGWNNGHFLVGSVANTGGVNIGTKKSNLTWGALQSSWDNNIGEGDRNNLVRYVTPTFAGFIASASWSEDDKYDAALRYAGEFSGIRIAAGIGYQVKSDVNGGDGGNGCANAQGNANGSAIAAVSNVNCSALGMSASVMHVGTGLFVTGAYGQAKDKNRSALYTPVLGAAGAATVSDKDKMFSIQAGVEQKWFSLGKSTIWGEYIKSTTGGSIGANGGAASFGAGDAFLNGVVAGPAFITGSEVKTIGVGFNQAIDAAAADFYIHARKMEGTTSVRNAAGVTGSGGNNFQAVMTGMIIRF